MNDVDPYQVLGITQPQAATWSDINRAYRRRLLQTHPDQGGTRDAFDQVQHAYQTLLDWQAHQEALPAAAPATAQSDCEPQAGFPRFRRNRHRPQPRRAAEPTGPRRAAP